MSPAPVMAPGCWITAYGEFPIEDPQAPTSVAEAVAREASSASETAKQLPPGRLAAAEHSRGEALSGLARDERVDAGSPGPTAAAVLHKTNSAGEIVSSVLVEEAFPGQFLIKEHSFVLPQGTDCSLNQLG